MGRKWFFWNFLSNCTYSTGLFFFLFSFLPFIIVYTCCCCVFLPLECLHYRRNFNENIKKYTLFWGCKFWNYPSNRAYETGLFLYFFLPCIIVYIFFSPLKNAFIIGAMWPIISKSSLSGGQIFEIIRRIAPIV